MVTCLHYWKNDGELLDRLLHIIYNVPMSLNNENAYKGIAGGDPRLRGMNKKKTPAKETFVCLDCNNKVTQVPNVKTPLVCLKCRSHRNHLHQQKIENERKVAEETWRLERRIIAAKTPLRSIEDMDALIQEAHENGFPVESCHDCGHSYFVYDEHLPFSQDPIGKINSITTIQFIADPFNAEINHDYTEYWLCRTCSLASSHNI